MLMHAVSIAQNDRKNETKQMKKENNEKEERIKKKEFHTFRRVQNISIKDHF